MAKKKTNVAPVVAATTAKKSITNKAAKFAKHVKKHPNDAQSAEKRTPVTAGQSHEKRTPLEAKLSRASKTGAFGNSK